MNRPLTDLIDACNEAHLYVLSVSHIFITWSWRYDCSKVNQIAYLLANWLTKGTIDRSVTIKKLTLFFSLFRFINFSKISQAIFLFADHVIWLSRTGLFKKVNTQKWSETYNKYWFFSIVMNLCRDFYEICRIFDTCRDVRQLLKLFFFPKSSHDLLRVWSKATVCVNTHQAVIVDTIKNVCDVFIPLSALGYSRLSPKYQGILGVISSMAGLFEILYPAAKLLPA